LPEGLAEAFGGKLPEIVEGSDDGDAELSREEKEDIKVHRKRAATTQRCSNHSGKRAKTQK